MRVFSVLLFVTFLPLAAAADDTKTPPEGWKEVNGGFAKKSYTVWLPSDGKFDDKETNMVVPKVGQIRVYRSVTQRKDGSLFAAGQISLPPSLVKEKAKVRQDFFRDAFLSEFDAKLVEEKKIKLDTMAGKEYTAKTDKGMARMRLYGGGTQMFRVLIVGTKEQVESKDADIMFDSFKRTPEKLKTKTDSK